MTELALTDGRRRALVELLDDQERMASEYPGLSEYLETAPRLKGSGDDAFDAAFDLRLIHFMVDDEGASPLNPYWEIVQPLVSERGGRRVASAPGGRGSARLAYAQTLLQSTYAYAIPSPATLEWIAGFCGDRSLVEVGAGRGYWAAQLSRLGLMVDASDVEPPDTAKNVSFEQSAHQHDVFYQVEATDSDRGLSGEQTGAVLFLCWPPGWGNEMASGAVARFEQLGGDRLVYVGEPKGGKTGDDRFFDILADRWRLSEVDPNFVSWWNLGDVAQGWVRR
ncbi:hypothetical protein [Amycolatopsis panacis]|uniref:Uncharacterized protein n=1 Tax=Amycolatopsis panacis TaxID=2340917 RepID=A0A419IBJ2_9PSEU|nr:hypothetical protein [Amycolatopsis panacis]RJQ92373.1 hypothetical protein D5S19_01005 [Amycolatopsis panacis]